MPTSTTTAAAAHRFAHLGIHLALQRPESIDEWHQAYDKVNERADALDALGLVTFLCSDNNDWANPRLWNPPGFKRLGGKGIDYIGVRVPSSLPAKDRPKVKVLKRAVANGTIDRHDFYGIKVEVTWPDEFKVEFWLVQANLGRGEPPQVFVTNVKRIKGKFQGKAIFSFDEIDEANPTVDEHAELGRLFRAVDQDQIAGWGLMTPTIIRGRQLELVSPRIWHASDGVAHISPARPLVESLIEVAAR